MEIALNKPNIVLELCALPIKMRSSQTVILIIIITTTTTIKLFVKVKLAE